MGEKKEKKEKKEKRKSGGSELGEGGGGDGGGGEAATRPAGVSVIARPLADDKLSAKVLKVVKKATKGKQAKRGVKEVVKALRKGTKGLCVIAGDISPIDVITHLPVLCEDAGVPYVYVPSKEELGAAGQTKRPTSCMLVLAKPAKQTADSLAGDDLKEFDDLYGKLYKKVKSIAPVF